jgi:hypothetical protein
MSDLPLTEWMPCGTKPVREGWYDIRRDSKSFPVVERARFRFGRWEPESTISGVAIWGFIDEWRGVSIDPETLK